jgi:hypothetical protein
MSSGGVRSSFGSCFSCASAPSAPAVLGEHPTRHSHPTYETRSRATLAENRQRLEREADPDEILPPDELDKRVMTP